VKSYPQDETIETTLLRGMIEVTRQDNPATPRVILKPNEKLILSKHLVQPALPRPAAEPARVSSSSPAPDISISAIAGNVPDSDKVETSWMYNKLVFNGDSFKELAQKMERWYNVRITFKDEELTQYRFGGVFVNETVTEALNALQLTAKFTYKIKGNEIDLYAK
jgi:transmembrane sensor